MSMADTQVALNRFNILLKEILDAEITSCLEITGSKNSQAYLLSLSNSKQMILRINKSDLGFEKDAYANLNFSSTEVPIPSVISVLPSNNRYYCLSEVAAGQLIDNFDDNVICRLLPTILETHLEISSKYISVNKTGYGVWNKDGIAPFKSWADYLVDNKNIDLFPDIYSQMTKLIKYCPNMRKLIHGDFGFNNVLSDGRKVTGVIDWSDSKYGDPLYDAAWIRFWSSEIDYYSMFYNLYNTKGLLVENYAQRIACYTCHLGMNILKFLKENKLQNDYDWAKNRLTKLIS